MRNKRTADHTPMKTPCMLFLLCAGTPFAVQAQQVIGSAGGVLIGTDATIEYNIGEAVIGTVESGNAMLTQGFEQPWAQIITLVPAEDTDDAAVVYPNPVRHFLNIQVPEQGVGQDYRFMDAAGRLVAHGQLAAIRTELDTEPLASGSYMLLLINPVTERTQSFRIIITH